MKRIRLTARKFRAESQADGLFPGDVGNKERKKNYHSPDEYTTYDWQPGWDVPDPNAPRIKDERDKIGLGIPKTASIYQTAKAAAVLAQVYLGDAAPEEEIEAQARDFMKLGHRRIVASIKRWKATEPAPEEGEETALVEAEACKANAEEVPNGTTAEGDVKISEDLTIDENADDLATVTANDPEEDAPELTIDTTEAQEEVGPVFNGSEELNQVEADPELEAMFDGAEETPVKEVSAKRTSKQGLKHLGGQPKFASNDSFGVKELEGIWTNLRAPGL